MLWALLWSLVWLGLPIAAWRMARRNRDRVHALEELRRQDSAALADLRSRVSRIEARLEESSSGAREPAPVPEHAAADSAVEPLEERPLPTPALEPPQVATPPPFVPPPPIVAPPPPVPPPAPLPPIEATTPPGMASGPSSDRTPPRQERPAPLRPPPPPRWSLPSRIDWESLVGVKLFSWIAGIALVFAAVFFLRYSIEHGWLGPSIRMAIGLLVGTGLLVACELRAARRYPITANAMDAAGIAILFSTLFAAHALWNLLPQPPVFLLMALVTAVAVLLSIRRDSVFIALLGLIGGFATPALLSTGEDRPIGLFGYLLLLNLGLAWVAYRKRWPLLSTLSVVFTAFYQWGWVLKFLDAARLPLAMGIFLIFPLLHVTALALARRDGERDTGDAWFEGAAAVSAVLPLLFSVYLAAVPVYGANHSLLFGFLLLVSIGLAAVAVLRGPELLHAIGGAGTLVAFVAWFALSYTSAAWPGVLGFLAAFVLLYLSAPLMARRLGRPRGTELQRSASVAALLLFAFPVLAALEPATAEPALLFGVLYVLLSAIAAVAVATEDGRLHFLSAFFALAGEAVWSAEHLTPERLLPALAMYAVFGLFYLAVPLVAEARGRKLAPAGSGAVVLFVSLAFLFFLATGPIAETALWGMALLLAILNLGLFVEASRGRLPILSVAGALLSWIVIGVWWATAMVAALLIPSLLIVAGFAALVLAGNAWAGQRGAGETATSRGSWLALVGHLFLLFVATEPDLALPPWPLFGVLALVDLAVGTAALYTRRARVHAGAVCASQVVVATWMCMVEGRPPWPMIALLSTCGVAAFAFVWHWLARRRGAPADGFAQAAVAGIFLAQVVVIIVAGQPAPPGVGSLLLAHVLLLAGLLVVAADREWHFLAVWAVLPPAAHSALAMAESMTEANWTEHLLLAAGIHAVFIAYPLVLGRRAGRSRAPYLAAVLASVVFFFLARRCMITAGFAGVIAILPLAQAVVMLGVLVRLLGIEAPAERRSARVALVAAAALAFVTVAIPLQLDREWITIGWALESAALAWLYRRIPHRGLLAWSGGLAAAVMVRLSANPAVLEYHPRADVPIFNWYLYTYLISAAAMFVSARLLRETDDRIVAGLRARDLLPAAGTVLLFLLLNIEIADFYSTGSTLTFDLSAGLAQDLTYTLGWASFAIGLLAAGIMGGRRIPRVAALGLLVITVLKCFLSDLWRLGGLYRVGSFVGLALCLAMVAILLQRFVLGAEREAA